MGFLTDALGITKPKVDNQVQALGADSNPDLVARRQKLMDELNQQMSGQGPSVADAYTQNMMGQNLNQQVALANSGRGATNPGLAQRIAAQSLGNSNAQIAGQGAMAKANEAMGARQQLGGIIDNGINANVQAQTAANTTNAGLADKTADRGQKGIGGLISGLGAAFAMAKGGVVPEPEDTVGSIIGYPGFPKPKKPLPSAQGGVVPGQAEVSGNSESNDKVHTLLSPGEVVIPRTVAKRKEFLEFISQFPEMHESAPGFGSVLAARERMKGRKNG